MFNLGTKSLFGLGVAALLAALVYGVVTDEGSGTTLLAFVAVGAISLGAVAISAGPDRTPVPAEGPPPQNPPAGGRPAFASIWPLAGAATVALFAIGAATDAVLVITAIVVAAAVLLGWVFQVWSEHPIFTARFGARLTDRLLVPVGLPIGVFALVLIIALSVSRVLLAVPKRGSVVVALVMAVVILTSAFFIASQERMARAALSVLCAVAFLAVLAAGAAGLAHGERTFEKKTGAETGPAASVPIATQGDNLAFSTGTLSFPAGQAVNLVFDNQSHGITHNIGVYDKPGGTELFKGDLVTGPKQVSYRVGPLSAGTYAFQCDVHPTMHGTVTVAAAGAPGSAGTAAATTTTTPAASGPTTTQGVTAGFATTGTAP